jgi:AcrR family transcriptional regulator
MSAKVLSITSSLSTRERLLQAVGVVLAREGFERITPDSVCAEAGVARALLFRYYNGLHGLVEAYGRTAEFWPPLEELMGGDVEALRAMGSEEQMAAFFKRFLQAMLRRPRTLEILAWESLERNELTAAMEDVRVRTALEFFEHLHDDIPEDIDLSAIVVLLAGAVYHLAVRSRLHRHFGGIDLRSERGLERIQQAIDLLLRGSFASGDGS